jgi:hypothetical protein
MVGEPSSVENVEAASLAFSPPGRSQSMDMRASTEGVYKMRLLGPCLRHCKWEGGPKIRDGILSEGRGLG